MNKTCFNHSNITQLKKYKMKKNAATSKIISFTNVTIIQMFKIWKIKSNKLSSDQKIWLAIPLTKKLRYTKYSKVQFHPSIVYIKYTSQEIESLS